MVTSDGISWRTFLDPALYFSDLGESNVVAKTEEEMNSMPAMLIGTTPFITACFLRFLPTSSLRSTSLALLVFSHAVYFLTMLMRTIKGRVRYIDLVSGVWTNPDLVCSVKVRKHLEFWKETQEL